MTNTIPKKMDGQKGQRQQCKKKHDNKTKNTDEDNNVKKMRDDGKEDGSVNCILVYSNKKASHTLLKFLRLLQILDIQYKCENNYHKSQTLLMIRPTHEYSNLSNIKPNSQ